MGNRFASTMLNFQKKSRLRKDGNGVIIRKFSRYLLSIYYVLKLGLIGMRLRSRNKLVS
jgi:hypothetical protein